MVNKTKDHHDGDKSFKCESLCLTYIIGTVSVEVVPLPLPHSRFFTTGVYDIKKPVHKGHRTRP